MSLKESDIREGFYWLRSKDRPLHFNICSVVNSNCALHFGIPHGKFAGEGFDEISKSYDFFERIEQPPIGVYEILEAWQAGEITHVHALARTGCENVEELYQAARSSGVDIRFDMQIRKT